MDNYPLLKDLLTLLAVAIPVSFLFEKIRLPSIVGFLVTGVIVGPYGAGLVSDIHAVQAMAEIGVLLLLFTIGVEFSLQHLLFSGTRIIVLALSQVLLTVGATIAVTRLLGIPLYQGTFLGFLVALSSTAVVLKLLSDRAEIDTPHGRIAVGILILQDLCIVPMMMLIPSLSGGTPDFLLIGRQLLIASFTLAGLFFASRYLIPLLLRQMVQLRNRDLFLITVLFISLGTAYATSILGLSLAIGAFIAGLVISESPYSHQILSDILPFRDSFNAIFFVSVGMLLDVSRLTDAIGLNLGLAGMVFFGKVAIVLIVLLIGKTAFRVSWITAFALAQIGEFSFLLAEQGRQLNLLPPEIHQLFLASSVLTMIFTPLALVLAAPTAFWLQRLFGRTEALSEAEIRAGMQDHLLIIGYGLNGQNLSRVVREVGIPFVVIELNDRLVREARKKQVPVVFGDATRREVLLQAGAHSARMAVIAISDASATRLTLSALRRLNRHLAILVRTRYVSEVESLMQLGANLVIPEEFETSIEIFSRVLRQYNIPDHLIEQQISVIRSGSYGMLRGQSLDQERLLEISQLFLKSTVQQVMIEPNSAASNKTLRDLDLRRQTGTTVIAVIRDENAIANPGPEVTLQEGDLLVLWGAHKELASAERLLKSAGPNE